MIAPWTLAVSEGSRAAVPLFLALALPVTLFVCRSVVRSQRSATYDDLVRALYPEGGAEDLPQLDLAFDALPDEAEKVGAGEHPWD